MASTLDLSGRQVDYWLTVYRRTWKGTIVSSFLTPLLYVVAMGVLLGGFVTADPATLEGAPTYLAFVVPGVLAGQAMQTGIGETTYPVMSAVKWHKVYVGMQYTPLRPLDIVNAHLGFVLFRLATTSAVFVVVVAPFGVFASVAGAVLAWLAAVLTGLAFATVVYAFSVGAHDASMFTLIFRLGVLPQYLFSGAFFPVANLSAPLERIARLTPLWHGVDLTRACTLGTLEAGPALVHVAYLLALLLVGHALGVRRLAKRLEV